MPAPYFLQRLGTGFQGVLATTLGGVANAFRIVSTGSAGVLDISLFPAGIGQDVEPFPASENLAAGAQVNLWTSSGTRSARNSDASAASGGKPSHGFVLAAVTSGQTAMVYRSGGLNTSQSGLTPGANYFLGAGGAVTATQNTTSGQTDQFIGTAESATVLRQAADQPFVVNA